MIYRIIKEIESSLKNGYFFAALALALTLPDICGKAEFPKDKNGSRYIKWFDNYVGQYEKPPKSDNGQHTAFDDMPYMSGEIVYQLRNCFLHQGTPSIEKGKIHEPQCQVTRFTLIISDATNGGNRGVTQSGFANSERTLEINIVNLCCKLRLAAKEYYEDNKDKFNFLQYDIQDRRKGDTVIM